MFANVYRRLLSPTQNVKICFTTFSKAVNKSDSTIILLYNTFNYKCHCLNQTSQFHANKMFNKIQKVEESISTLQMKKRPIRKKRIVVDKDASIPGFWNLKAFATAEEYDLEALMDGLIKQNLYSPVDIQSPSIPNAIQVVAKYEVNTEPREIFFFREGAVVMWNINELECNNLLQFLKKFEENSYSKELIEAEQEVMFYNYTEQGKRSFLKKGNICLSANENLDKYTFSNALSQTVKLGIWETALDRYIDSIEFVTEDLKKGQKIKMTRPAVLRKQGELFALRHLINLSSDLLDTPDFYWERDDLEVLYRKTCAYFSITKRTKVINEKINHCVELVELLSSHLSDRHHVRLEWMIIVLIMVEVAFEIVHYLDRYIEKYKGTSVII